jgi:hypothetical protein
MDLVKPLMDLSRHPDEFIETIDKILRAAEVFVGASIFGPQFLTVAKISRALDYRKLAVPSKGGFRNLAGELSST